MALTSQAAITANVNTSLNRKSPVTAEENGSVVRMSDGLLRSVYRRFRLTLSFGKE